MDIGQLLRHIPTFELGWRASDLQEYVDGLTDVIREQACSVVCNMCYGFYAGLACF